MPRVSRLLSLFAGLVLVAAGGCNRSAPAPDTTASKSPPATAPERPTASPEVPPAAPPAAPGATTAPAASIADPTAPPADDPGRVADAERLIDEMIKVYSTAPTLTDYVVQESWVVDKEQPLRTYHVSAGLGSNIRLDDDFSMFMWLAGQVYIEDPEWPDRYLHVPSTGANLLEHCDTEYAGFVSPLRIHMALRYARSHADVIDALDLEAPDRSRISSYRVRKDARGRDREVLTLISATGSARYSIDPKTKLLVEGDIEYQASGAPEGFVIRKHLVFHCQIHDELPEPLRFDPAGRTRVMKMSHLHGRE